MRSLLRRDLDLLLCHETWYQPIGKVTLPFMMSMPSCLMDAVLPAAEDIGGSASKRMHKNMSKNGIKIRYFEIYL